MNEFDAFLWLAEIRQTKRNPKQIRKRLRTIAAERGLESRAKASRKHLLNGKNPDLHLRATLVRSRRSTVVILLRAVHLNHGHATTARQRTKRKIAINVGRRSEAIEEIEAEPRCKTSDPDIHQSPPRHLVIAVSGGLLHRERPVLSGPGRHAGIGMTVIIVLARGMIDDDRSTQIARHRTRVGESGIMTTVTETIREGSRW